MSWWSDLRERLTGGGTGATDANPHQEVLLLALSPTETPEAHMARFEVLGLLRSLGNSHRELLEASVRDAVGGGQPWWWPCRQLMSLAGDRWPLVLIRSEDDDQAITDRITTLIAPRLPGLQVSAVADDEDHRLHWETRVRTGTIPIDREAHARSVTRGLNGILRDHRNSERLIVLQEYRGELAIARAALEIAGRAKRAGWASWDLPET